MKKLLGAAGLAAIALFMLTGYLASGLGATGSPAALAALALTVWLPAFGAAFEAVGEAAGGVFEAVVDIISGIF